MGCCLLCEEEGEEEKKKKKKKALYSSIATNPGSNDAESLPIAFD